MEEQKVMDFGDYTLVESGKVIKGVVKEIGPIEIYEHEKYGKKPYVRVYVEFNGVVEDLRLFLPTNKIIRPNSTIGKLLKACKCANLDELVGKQVDLRANKDGYLRFDVD
jgi:hypothetical protein